MPASTVKSPTFEYEYEYEYEYEDEYELVGYRALGRRFSRKN